MIRRLLATLAPFVWMGLIFFLSSRSALPGPPQFWMDFIQKKLGHIAVYGILYLSWVWCFQENNIKVHWLTPVALCFFYAGTDELHQLFTPTRSPALRDVGFDMLGVMIALLWRHKYI